MRLLFVTWDGPGTTYHENLFVPLLREATDSDDSVHLLQFHWGDADRTERVQRLADRIGMRYDGSDIGLQKRPYAVPLAVLDGARTVRRALRDEAADVVLVRSVMPGAMMVGAVRTLRRRRPAIIYDADGLPADERLEFGGWRRRDPRYLLFRALERAAIRSADAVITRSAAAVEILSARTGRNRNDFAIVVNGREAPSAADLSSESRTLVRDRLGVASDAPLIAYAGSIGDQYLPEDMFRLVSAVAERRPDTHLAVFTSEQHHARIHQLAADHEVENLTVRSLAPEDVSRHLAACDLGLALRRSSVSQQGVAPIKVAEYLLCGLPVLYSPGVGDLDSQLTESVAHPISAGDEPAAAARWFLEDVLLSRESIRAAATALGRDEFSLARGAEGYRRAFDLALATSDRPTAARNGRSKRS